MGGTRIIVWKMKDIIKIGVIAAVGLAAIILLVVVLTGRGGGGNGGSIGLGLGTGTGVRYTSGEFLPGTYSAQIILHNNPVNVNVTVTDRTITAIEMSDMLPTQELMFPLFRPTIEELSREIIRRQSTNIALDGNAIVTSQILLDAVNSALAQARDAAEAAAAEENAEQEI